MVRVNASSLGQSHASATTGAWPYRVLQSVILSMWSSWGCEIQTSLNVSDLKICHKRSERIDLLFISHAQLPVPVARCII